MADVVEYIVGGVIALLLLLTLAQPVFDSWAGLSSDNVTVNGTEYSSVFEVVPGGVEAALAAVLTIFFVLVLWKMYKES